MREHYRDFNFRSDTYSLITFMNSLIDDYLDQGFTLSVRQLYYQLVARDIVENTERSYKRVASIINDARLAGLIDWDAIEDRGRDITLATRWESGSSIVRAAANSFHMDMWDNQENRVFVVVEKAALAGILEGVCRQFDVPLLAARGYPSVSIVREIVEQHISPADRHGQYPTILHLGDHDPSGIDMTRDLEERIGMFMRQEPNEQLFTVDRIALTMWQIEEKRPPPNPAKTTDARFTEYRKRYGSKSWELDALEPAYLVNLVSNHVQGYIDHDKWDERREYVESVRAKLTKAADRFGKENL